MIHPAGSELAVLGAIALLAAVVNGALGYGFSSITVPVALLYLSNRVLNPAMVPVEVGANLYILFVNRGGLRRIFRRTLPIVLGILPGVAAGSWLLDRISPVWLKFATYLLLLPVILLQAGGFRREIKAERKIALPFGVGIGALYALTTISGPPLAALLHNQGFAKEEFRAALGLIRTAESAFTAAAYYFLGLYSLRSFQLAGAIVPSLVIGIPIGTRLIRRMSPETFRRFCMSFDAWVVGFGLSKVLASLHLLSGRSSYAVLLAVAAADFALLISFFAKRRRGRAAAAAASAPAGLELGS